MPAAQDSSIDCRVDVRKVELGYFDGNSGEGENEHRSRDVEHNFVNREFCAALPCTLLYPATLLPCGTKNAA